MKPQLAESGMDDGVSMNFHFRKEVRCILPYWLLALGVILGLRMLSHRTGWQLRLLIPPTCAILTIMLGAATFGSEFQCRTMPVLILQPLERAVLWRAKMIFLGLALFSVVVAVRLMPAYLYPDRQYPFSFFGSAIFVFGMAPWLTLVARDGLIGAGLTFAVAGVLEIITKALFDPYPGYFFAFEFVVSVLLSVIGCHLGRQAFMRWEFTPRRRPGLAWLDSVFARRATVVPAPTQKQAALDVLVRKEFRLQTVSIAFAAVFCLGFAVIVLLVHFLPDREPLLKHFVQIYCAMFPVIAGAVSVAGERQLGFLEWHLSLPISVVRQFLVKMGVCFTLALGAGFLLPWVLLRMCGPLPGWFPAPLVFLLVLGGTTAGVCSSSLQAGALRAAITGLVASLAVVLGGLWLRDILIHRGIYVWFYSGPAWLCNHFTAWGMMVLALVTLLRLALEGYRESTMANRSLRVVSAMILAMGVLLAAGLLAVWPD